LLENQKGDCTPPVLEKVGPRGTWASGDWVLRPVKREPVQKCGVPPVASNIEEVLLEALIGLLEECQQHPLSNTVEANPLLQARALRFEEIQEHVYYGVWPRQWHRMAKAFTNAQLFWCNWAGATITSVRRACSKGVKGRRRPSLRKKVE